MKEADDDFHWKFVDKISLVHSEKLRIHEPSQNE